MSPGSKVRSIDAPPVRIAKWRRTLIIFAITPLGFWAFDLTFSFFAKIGLVYLLRTPVTAGQDELLD